MKAPAVILAVSLSAFACLALAQRPNAPIPNGQNGPGGSDEECPPPPPVPALLSAVDTNMDGIIDTDEIQAASRVLGAMALKSGGSLEVRDLMPPPPFPPGAQPGAEEDDANTNPHPPTPGPRSDAQRAGPDERPAGGPPEFQGGRPPHPMPPLVIAAGALIHALDTNGDGILDATEIASAAESLKTLDTDHDGRITMYELLRPHPPGLGPDRIGRTNQRRSEAKAVAVELKPIPVW